MNADDRDRIARKAVLSVVGSRIPQPADFDDMAQDALVAVWRAEESWDGRGSLVGRCTAVARWAIIDGLRTRAGRGNGRPKSRPVLVSIDTDDWPDVLAATDDTERAALARLQLAETAQRIATLTPLQAQVMRAAATGISPSEIARRRGVSASTVCASRRSALAKIA